ncbi:MAG: alkane 1-monooxygenase [Chroococcidiopsidaceae cyanobacterium CP_BM_ER_R8_30]|nr:alkane 1-monooxygenase [Chroococcidiopsidaceae cyanobacterium CP_BM_ER_R8_30]
MTQRQPWWIYVTSLGFGLAYALPAIPIMSGWLGKIAQHPNFFAFLPLVIAYAIVPMLEGIFSYGIQPIPDSISSAKAGAFYYRFLLWSSLPMQLGSLYLALNYWDLHLFNTYGSLAYLLSVGLYSGMFAITVAHELIHHQQRSDRILGGILLSTVGFGCFKVVHLRIHHRYVCTPFDFATAQRGQSIYDFWWKNLFANFREAIRYESEELTKIGQSFWHSELLVWYLFSLLWLSMAILLGGWQGGFFWIVQAIIAMLKLDWTNYLQHYGLTRKQYPDGRYEPMQVHYAWSVGLFIHDLALFNLLRHGDHHVNPQQHYQTLRHYDRVPEYPYNYSVMYLLSLIPPLFQRIVHPYIDGFEVRQTQLQEV